jgi:hypothetical protein
MRRFAIWRADKKANVLRNKQEGHDAWKLLSDLLVCQSCMDRLPSQTLTFTIAISNFTLASYLLASSWRVENRSARRCSDDD